MVENINEETFKNWLFSDNNDTREIFLENFECEINEFIAIVSKCYRNLKEFAKELPSEERVAWVENFLFQSINSIFTSFHLLISGFFIPAGNLMRQFSEFMALSLLFSHPKTNEFERFKNKPESYPYHKALNKIKKKENIKLFDINPEAWDEFVKITSFYNKFSHPSIMTAASIQIFSKPGTRILGGGYDSDKKEAYRKELKLRISACERLIDTIDCIKTTLK